MDKNYLLETAMQLKRVSVKTAEEYHQNAEKLVTEMNTLQK
jgi:hypothetical protein